VTEEAKALARRLAGELRSGAVVAFPTETFYALGADPRCPPAVSEVFRLKGRPGDRRLPWIAASRAQVEAVCLLPETAARLADRCWPGPVTLVLPSRAAPGEGVAVRVSSHPLAREIAEALGHPVVSTSANPSGAPPLRDAAAVRDAFAGRGTAPLRVLDGGATPGGEPSAIVDLTGASPRVLRGTFPPGLLL
jgi:L-threonylcarbamoyladenylate synthase